MLKCPRHFLGAEIVHQVALVPSPPLVEGTAKLVRVRQRAHKP